MGYQHLDVEVGDGVGTIWLNRPDARNALSADMWADLPSAAADLASDESARVIVLAGRGPAFTVGIDLGMLGTLHHEGPSLAAANMALYEKIAELQKTASCLADTPKPVIAAVQGYCLGAGVDLISACDMRLCTEDAVFSIRETRMGLVADIGSLQRLPAIVGSGALAEMAYTGGDFGSDWALRHGLVSSVHPDHESLMKAAGELAREVASNSPLVTAGIKRVLAAGEGRTVAEALDYVAQWNSSFLISNDLSEALAAFAEKREPEFGGD